MKILYAIQGTGNGHISRACDIVPCLQKWGVVDVLASNLQSKASLPFEIKYHAKGIGFPFGKSGGIDYIETYRKSHIKKLFAEVAALPVHQYDIVISDFEPVSAWACYTQNKPCIGLSHQMAVANRHAPHPAQSDLISSSILKYYAPATYKYGFHFLAYDSNIFTPIIRQDVRRLQPYNAGHYSVYLPAYSSERILNFLSLFPDIRWEVFARDHANGCPYKNICVKAIDNAAFLASLEGAAGVLCGAGFETPAEAVFLNKKLMVIPMQGQYEQQCNAAALQMLGVPVIKSLKLKQFKKVAGWLDHDQHIGIEYPDQTEAIIERVLKTYLHQEQNSQPSLRPLPVFPKFRQIMLRKLFHS